MKPMVKMHHIALSVPNLEESVQWYKDVLGLEVLSRQTIPHNGVNIAFIGNEDFIIEILGIPDGYLLPKDRSHPDTDNSTHGVKHICIAVDNNVEFVKQLKAKGVKVVFEPENMPRYAAFINDNTGNIIEIFDTDFDISTVGNK